MADDAQSRNSIGDAFLESVNRDINKQNSEAKGSGRETSHGLRYASNSNQADRLSMGDHFLQSVKMNDDNRLSQGVRSTNIFNKARAIKKAGGEINVGDS